MNESDIKPGSKYIYRRFPTIKEPDLHRIKVISVSTLGDGTKVVKYRYGLMTEYVEVDEFLQNVAVKESKL